jgi:hypothetical protein
MFLHTRILGSLMFIKAKKQYNHLASRPWARSLQGHTTRFQKSNILGQDKIVTWKRSISNRINIKSLRFRGSEDVVERLALAL